MDFVYTLSQEVSSVFYSYIDFMADATGGLFFIIKESIRDTRNAIEHARWLGEERKKVSKKKECGDV